MSHIVIVVGSPIPGSRLNGLINYAENKLVQQGHKVSYVRVVDLPAEALVGAHFQNEQIVEAVSLVQAADGIIIASPVFKAAYTGVLKAFLDLLPQTGLRDKIVLPLFIGGTMAHLLSIDYALKPVLNALGCWRILQGVYSIDQWVERLEEDKFKLADELVERLEEAVVKFSEEVQWLATRQ